MRQLVIAATLAFIASSSSDVPFGRVDLVNHDSYLESLDDAAITEFSEGPQKRSAGFGIQARGAPTFKSLDSNLSASLINLEHVIRRAPANPNTDYHFPPPAKLPLPSCFYNPSGYVCCNRDMYSFLERTYNDFISQSGRNPCNIQSVINHVHQLTQERYNVSMEGMLALDDFAQKVRFRGNFACKLDIGGRYMMVYATPTSTDFRRKREVSNVDPAHIDNEHAAFF